MRLRDLHGKTQTCKKKRIAIISCDVEASVGLRSKKIGDWDRGDENVPNARGEGGTRPGSCPSKTWTPKLRFSVARGQFQGP